MKLNLLLFKLFLLIAFSTNAQYYLTGELKDDKGNFIAYALINLKSKGTYPFYSGNTGVFGIPSSAKVDSIFIFAEGFEVYKASIQTTSYQIIKLKPSSGKVNTSKSILSSITKNLITNKPFYATIEGESYSTSIENEFVDAKLLPETGISIHVDRASYSNIRRFLNIETKVPQEAVRIEEMLNYFNLKTETKEVENSPFYISTHLTNSPWNNKNKLLAINVKAKKLDLEKVPASNLVFLIDISGSMDMPGRLPLLKSAFKLLVDNLRPIDTVSIIAYGGETGIMLQPTSGIEKQKIIDAVEGLSPSGSTPGASAIRMAYLLASKTFIKNGNNRIILATDGDFNVGQSTEKELEELIVEQKKQGISLTCLGVGMGNYKDSKLEILAKKGNGNFAYLDNEAEVEKVLFTEFTQTLYTVASDVYLNVNFNAGYVKSYRLIGYDNKLKAIEDSSTQLEGGEVGSGHSVMALFEIVQQDSFIVTHNNVLAQLQMQYKLPQTNAELKRKITIPYQFTELEKIDSSIRFSAAVALFGSALKNSKFYKDINWDYIKSLAESSSEKNNLLQSEFILLVEKAKKIYALKKRK